MVKKILMAVGVICGAIIVTALGIDAADTIRGSESTLLARVVGTRDEDICGKGMVPVDTIPGIRCVDEYEARTHLSCPVASPKSTIESYKNTESQACIPESTGTGMPWTYVTRDQAMQLCARAGKRLPTSAEWYALSMGMTRVEEVCNVASNRSSEGGVYPECVTPFGAFDLVGNVWEWMSDDVIDGVYSGRALPPDGYVRSVDNGGMAVETSSEGGDMLYGEDYFWAGEAGVFGIVRGGYYDSGTDAGLFSVHADSPTNSASAGIGFRCVK